MKIQVEDLSNLTKKGIYSITNTLNGKKYIGSTAKSFKARFTQHQSKLNRNKHHCSHLQAAYNLYGGNYFLFTIEQIVEDVSNIRDIEQEYILKYNTVEDGYNENDNPNYSPMLNNTQQDKVSKSLKAWWKHQKETLSPEEYKQLCMSHRGTSAPWNKGITMSEQQKSKMRTPKINGVSAKMKEVHYRNAKRFKEKSPYYVVFDINGNWINTFFCLSDLVSYSKSEYNTLPIISRKGSNNILDESKVVNAATANKPYKGLFFKRVPKDRKLPCANGLNSWKAEMPIMSQAESTLSEGAETTGEV